MHTGAEEKMWYAFTTFVKKSVSNTQLLPNNVGYSSLLRTEIEYFPVGHLTRSGKKKKKKLAEEL